ncbi:MAG TPA: type II secretion system protein [Candidatus Saccharimonadales bacterium]|nr:type II secretion system protein [Candidatus Saccharimonadales bacterium]
MIGAKDYHKNKQQKRGFSLIEVLVSVSLFVIIILSATEIFRLVIQGQRDAIASQNVQESLKYFFEVIGKEMRMAKKNENVCPVIPADKIFLLETNSLGDILRFRNYYDECVYYYLELDNSKKRFKIARNTPGNLASGFISPAKIIIDTLDFALDETGQVAVTVNIKAWADGESRYKSEMDIQTTISSRYYR